MMSEGALKRDDIFNMSYKEREMVIEILNEKYSGGNKSQAAIPEFNPGKKK